MTPLQKHQVLASAMETKTRDDGKEYICFTDNRPDGLWDIFADHCDVVDRDYEIFSKAIDTLAEMELDDILKDELGDPADREHASVYTYARLQYIDSYNQAEISEFVRELGLTIEQACAYWYDEQVEKLVIKIAEWIREEEGEDNE